LICLQLPGWREGCNELTTNQGLPGIEQLSLIIRVISLGAIGETMKHASSKTSKEKRAAGRRGLILVVSCLVVIFSAVLAMNLERPSIASKTSRLDEIKSPIEGGVSAVAVRANLSAGEGLRVGGPITEADANTLSVKKLLLPVAGVAPSQLHDSYYDSRSEGRVHQALDIMAPRDTPVLATEDGTVVKLHQSARGGTMLYESDPSGLFVYYYGHLSRYADGVAEGKQVKRGEVIAYVGDTGNAGPGNYHLHFGISRVTASGKWSGGEPINPYPLLTDKQGTLSIGGK
jgi:murein DD-endopeptidase MepM/ murein hydrolase activator NlpD